MKVKLEKFEGPLDLLLQLIESEELDITEVSIAQVAEQYIEHLNKMDDFSADEVADFLFIASRLLYIKSRILLPDLDMNDEDSFDLEQQLKMYKKYSDASMVVAKILSHHKNSFSRLEDRSKTKIKFAPSKNLTPKLLATVFSHVIDNINFRVKLPRKSLEKLISIKEKIAYIKEIISSDNKFGFGRLLSPNSGRQELIVTFLGLLELVKQRAIVVKQNNLFTDIEIEKYKL